jgi:acetyl-CoA carboxylase biotin carboxyl carrier protein
LKETTGFAYVLKRNIYKNEVFGGVRMTHVKAQMAGTVFEVAVKEGDSVVKGQTLIILESMKMEIPCEAEVDGVVVKVAVAEGDFVEEDEVLVELA